MNNCAAGSFSGGTSNLVHERVHNPSMQWMKLRLLPFAIGIIAITTMVPLELRHPSRIFVDIQFEPWDMLLNLFLYIPLGMAMVESSLARCTLTGFSLSLC